MPVTSVAVHAFPECKDIWTQLDSTSQKQVLALGSRIWDAPENEVGESISKELHELESRGVLVQEDGKWCFTLPQMLFFVQSINLIDSLSLHSRTADELLHDLGELFWTARPHSFRRHRDYQNLVSFVIAQLVNEFDRLDLIESVVSEETMKQDFWQFYEPICQALPILELSIESFTTVLRDVANRVQGDLTDVRIYSATEYLGRFRPEFAFKLVDSFAAIEDWGTSGFLEKLLTGIAMASPDYFDIIVARSEAWLDSDIGNLCQAALYCLQNLILNGKLEPNRLLSRADSLASKSIDGFRHALSSVIAILGASFEQCAEKCLNILQRLKEEGPLDQVAHGIAVALSQIRDNAAFDFKTSCLPLLTDVPIANKVTIKKIGWLLYPIAHSCPGEVWKYLEGWILAHQLEESITEHNLFLSTVQNAYKCDPNLGSLVVTRWFASPDLRLVEEARSILRELKIHGFAAREINSMSPQTIMYITEKLLVGRLESTQMIWLCYNILQKTSKIEELEDYFLRVLRYLELSQQHQRAL